MSPERKTRRVGASPQPSALRGINRGEVADMKRALLFFVVVAGIGLARPAHGIKGMCAAASFFNYQVELFNDLCWVELEMTGEEPPDQRDYPYSY